MNKYYPHLFEPITIGRTTFKNRIWSSPNMMPRLTQNGAPDDYMIAYFAEKAKGGAAVVTLGMAPVDRKHAASVKGNYFNICEDNFPHLAELAYAVHQYGAKISIELMHCGNAASETFNTDGPVGPIDMERWDGVHVRAMTEDDMNEAADHFADCAEILKRAGFDMCLIHGGHGWLLDSFISPLYNKRTDEYGGSLENRARFPLMVVDRIRERVGKDFLIEYRFSCDEHIEGGTTKEEGVEFAKLLDGKVDLLHVSAGLDIEDEQAVILHPTIFLPHGTHVHLAQAVKEAGVKTPVITVGAISDPEMAEDIIASGKADIVAMARAIIADPEFPNKARIGKADEIRPCMRCLDCLTGLHTGPFFRCAVNPCAGHEFRYRNCIKPAVDKKRVLVVGGGPGGMRAAMTAADRGHDVTLVEKTDSLGGLLKFTDKDDLKMDLRRVKDWLIRMVGKKDIRVLLNTEVTKEFAESGNYDAIIVASGSLPFAPPIPGIENLYHATEMYDHVDEMGHRVIFLGGGITDCEAALYLAERGHECQIIEMMDDYALDANWMHKEGMRQAFEKANVKVNTGLRVAKIEPGKIVTTDKEGNEVVFECDNAVYAMGMKSQNKIYEELRESADYVVSIGDCITPRKSGVAMYEGFWAAINLS